MLKKFTFFVLIISVFTMCSKRTDSLIVGEWDVEDVGQDDFSKDAYWTFYSDGRVEIYQDRNALPTGLVTGKWESFTRGVITPYIEITELGAKGMDGKWRVETVNRTILVINRVEFSSGQSAGAFLRREFTRKE